MFKLATWLRFYNNVKKLGGERKEDAANCRLSYKPIYAALLHISLEHRQLPTELILPALPIMTSERTVQQNPTHPPAERGWHAPCYRASIYKPEQSRQIYLAPSPFLQQVSTAEPHAAGFVPNPYIHYIAITSNRNLAVTLLTGSMS